ncbi:hypothetical protein [Rhizobium halophytocola]|uniref:Uncharacterized protein n=1 Tax=Rhizobium halophytocola TaxID=735519 RepID=A0ABS4DYP9_9HYPH|nr:hypothetical protein [Rhizobium halophytocola]MBP1850817.1 hypothetical protein [Rhizobium halophytocola]
MSPHRFAATLSPRYSLTRALAATLLSASLLAPTVGPAFALSDLTSQQSADPGSDDQPMNGGGLEDEQPLLQDPSEPGAVQDTGGAADTGPDDKAEFPTDITKAPEPVKRMRDLIMKAAVTGDVEKLRPLLNPGPNQTQLLLGGDDSDPVETIKGFSGDDDGLEVLAILLDILNTGFARINAGTADEMYVWPYFAEKNINALTAPEKVDLLRIVTAGDLTGMQESGNYNFFRVGISPDGQWKFFTAGD